MVEDALEEALNRVNTSPTFVHFGGECRREEVVALRDHLTENDVDVLIGIGGGKAIDTAKLAADGVCPIAVIPTLASTCAPWTVLSVVYNSDGTHRRGVQLSRCPEWLLVDPSIIAEAPHRHLANGIMDAAAKHFETSLIGDDARPTPRWASVLATDVYETELRSKALTAVDDAKNDRMTDTLTDITDAVIAGPGIPAGLLSNDSYLTLPHALCYTMLEYGTVQADSYQGERVAYGVLVLQALLEDYSASLNDLRSWYAALGLEPTLRRLGAQNVEIDQIARDAYQNAGIQLSSTVDHL